jgi:hypothetical protein
MPEGALLSQSLSLQVSRATADPGFNRNSVAISPIGESCRGDKRDLTRLKDF